MTITIYHFNNLYNRIVKRLETLEEYEAAGELLQIYEQINFNPNDGVTTEQVLNMDGDSVPDYLIVSDRTNTIVSRWFVAEAVRTRLGQYRMSLIRDVVADWYDEIVTAPAFIEKGFVSSGDPAIFNNENMTYNQIKTSEKLIKDFSGCAWIVGYLAKNAEGAQLQTPSPFTPEINYPNGFENYQYNIYSENTGGKFYANPADYCARLNAYFVDALGDRYDYCFVWDKDANSIAPFNPDNRTGVYYNRYMFKKTEQEGYKSNTALVNMFANQFGLTIDGELKPYIDSFERYIKEQDWTDITTFPSIVKRPQDYELILKEAGKIILNDGVYYKIRVEALGNDSVYTQITAGTDLKNKMDGVRNMLSQRSTNGYQFLTNSPTNPVRPYLIETKCTSYRIYYDPIEIDQMEINVTGDRRHCKDQPYDVFAIPFGNTVLNSRIISYTNENFAEFSSQLFGSPLTPYDPDNPSADQYVGFTCSTTQDAAYQLAQLLIQAFGKERLYDIQLLPFCPIDRKYFDEGNAIATFLPGYNGLDVKTVTPIWYDYTQAQGAKIRAIVSYMWWLDSAQFSIELQENISAPSDPIEFKVANETEIYRLVSPNYQGQFEFSVTKNGGITGWTIDCAYKPYQPYIKIAPLFGRLYGKDFNDARGLILGGDFSLSQISDAWVSYQINNKNFQNQFDRQIVNMEVNNSVQRELERWNVAASTVGAVGNFVAAPIALGGNPVAGAVGGAISGGMSIAAGIRDIQLNEKLRQEAIDYTKDQFGYQLQNIQALPYSLNKVSTFNPDYKLFPVLELYTCTDIEKQALRDKIKYNGMTIMRIGAITYFLGSEPRYVKGKIIRLEGIKDDYHVINAIANEINKGVFI